MERISSPEVQPFEREGIEVVRRTAPECMVLLRNERRVLPLQSPKTIALCGNGARHTVKGGTGSGDVNVRYFITVEEGLHRAGIEITTEDWLDAYDRIRTAAERDFFRTLRREAEEKGVDPEFYTMWRTSPEPDYESVLTDQGDAAVYVLARRSGEGIDRQDEPGDVRLTETEVRDIRVLNRAFSHFVLVLNVGGVIDLAPVAEVQTVLLMSQLGSAAGDALADVLLGKSYPSGKLTTTWAAMEDYPSTDGFGAPDDTYYREGIYVGYRYFDTANIVPCYPFGFGLSYTQFSIEDVTVHANEEEICVQVTVRNVGDAAGKETVQLYVSAPAGEFDQPYQELRGYAKTRELLPGENERVTISVIPYDLASFDTEQSAYVLTAGIYWLRIGTSSDNTKIAAGIHLDKSVIVERVCPIYTGMEITENKPVRQEREADAADQQAAPMFHLDACAFAVKTHTYRAAPTPTYTDGNLSWRAVVQGTASVEDFVAQFSNEELARVCIGFYSETSGGNVIGNASVQVAGGAGETSHALAKYGVPRLVMADGPAGLRLERAYMCTEDGEARGVEVGTAGAYYQYCTAIPIGTALAQSWNEALAFSIGDLVGREMERFGVQIWLAPALNIHRSPLCGRNFEYYSEDPLLSGRMGAALVRGVQSRPHCAATVKHFACNNQETNRYTSNSVLGQRALREIYLKPFQICVQEARPHAVMTAYNLINGEHASSNRGLLTDVLRNEWGFDGFIMSDWFVTGVGTALYDAAKAARYASAAGHVRAGNDVTMPGSAHDLREILSAVDNATHAYPLSREDLLIAAAHVLKQVLRLSPETNASAH